MSHQANIWRQIRANPGCQSIAALAGDAGAPMKSTRHYVYALLKTGLLEICEKRPDQTHRYKLVKDTGPVPPRHNGKALVTEPTDRYRVWQAMRVLRQFCHSDLVAAVECTPKPVRQLCADLKRAGYVRVIKPACRPAGREARYQLLRNPGPLPLVRHAKTGRLTDPNTNEEFE